MHNWTQAIYDATGIPLSERDLSLSYHQDQLWLVLHRCPVLPVGSALDPHDVITPAARTALAHGMVQCLSDTIPRVQHIIAELDAERAREVAVAVVCLEDGDMPQLNTNGRGWPHFLLRLSAGGFVVEIDLNPYVPAAPFERDEVRRQADVILQIARGNTRLR